MKRLLRALKIVAATMLVAIVGGGALLGYFVYTPDAVKPALSADAVRRSIRVDGVARSYRLYVPRGLPTHAPLVVVLHGSGESGAQVRMETGYGFDRLADRDGFAVVYPDAASFDWNDCSRIGDFAVDGHDANDVGFVVALTDRLVAELALDPGRVFATGVSAGGFLALRLAIEAPARFRAVAAVSANVPAPDNFKCRAAGPGSSVLLMNGTKDPLVPFDGGEVSLLGLFYKNGHARASSGSARYFADLARIVDAPATSRIDVGDGIRVERSLWRGDAGIEVELDAIVGGGHGMPQGAWRRPRLLGPSPMAPDGPAWIWDFFARQRPRAVATAIPSAR